MARKKDRGAMAPNTDQDFVVLTDGTVFGERTGGDTVSTDKPPILFPAIKNLFLLITGIGLIIGILYLALAVYLAAAIPTKDAGHTWVLRTSLPGGIAPSGKYLFMSQTTIPGNSTFERAQQVWDGVETGGVYYVLGGPNGDISNSGDMSIIFDGNFNGIYGKLPIKQGAPYRLQEQYAVMCVAGDCVKDEVYILPSAFVVGEAGYRVDGFKVHKYEGAYPGAVKSAWKTK